MNTILRLKPIPLAQTLFVNFEKSVRHLSQRVYDYTITRSELSKLPVFRLPATPLLVKSFSDDASVGSKFLSSGDTLGLHTTRLKSDSNKNGLLKAIQIATKDLVAIWDLENFKEPPASLIKIINDPDIIKVCHGAYLEMDLFVDELQCYPSSFIDLEYIGLHTRCSPNNLLALSGIFLHKKIVSPFEMSQDLTEAEMEMAMLSYEASKACITRQILFALREKKGVPRLHCEKLFNTSTNTPTYNYTFPMDPLDSSLALPQPTISLLDRLHYPSHTDTLSSKQSTTDSALHNKSRTLPKCSPLAQLVAECVNNEYKFQVEIPSNDYENIKSSFKINMHGQEIYVSSLKFYRTLKEAQNDAALQGLRKLASLKV